MSTRTDRAVAGWTDVVAIEEYAPGMVRVVTVRDARVVDARHERCDCPDMAYNLDGEARCKHLWAALDATGQLPTPGTRPVEVSLGHQGRDSETLPDFEDSDPETAEEVEYI